jgi:hypothetical protein
MAKSSFSWVGHLSWLPVSFLLSKTTGCPPYINTPPMAKPLASVCTSNGSSKLGYLQLVLELVLNFKEVEVKGGRRIKHGG